MPDPSPDPQTHLSAATRLFYAEGIGRRQCRRHRRKSGRDQADAVLSFQEQGRSDRRLSRSARPTQSETVPAWFSEAEGGLPTKVEAIFSNLARSARHPKWKGCGFLRTAAELANMPGHPAIKIGAAHKTKFEEWLRATFAAEGITDPCGWHGKSCFCSTGRSRSAAAPRSRLYGNGGRGGACVDRGRASCAERAGGRGEGDSVPERLIWAHAIVFRTRCSV